MELIKITLTDVEKAMCIINMAKKHLKDQGIDQWQDGYPDTACITNDAKTGKGYFLKENDDIYGYLCVDFDGEKAYDTLNGTWACEDEYVVMHRLAISENSRGKGLGVKVFKLVEQLAASRGIHYFRVDTSEGNQKMQHILKKNGFEYRGVIWYDNGERIAFDKHF